ncbi:hypothetical protein GNP79_06260 [Aliivibrio fischeri]|uniref:Uncharacterized protein n=1 Tax=Aliivibrio fischeri TaxID=668 RepID=A0A6N3YYC9_ALIFS|nr:hypothetical protein [Aliivibrio fischeri]MUK44747.1 hypothetical protein [Aliivibrio fischeri]MUK80406.1 hypothetical protein [Aliivibrio fischeri]MUK84585.1 hypothetical protein [Aliivibrio fischeri]
MYFKLNQLAMVSLLTVGVVGTASANVYIDHNDEGIRENSILVVKSDLNKDEIKNPKFVWKDEKGTIVGLGKKLIVTPDILGNSQNLTACISYINQNDLTSSIQCSNEMSLNNVQTLDAFAPRINEKEVSDVLVGKFIAATEVVNLSYSVYNKGETTPIDESEITAATYQWRIDGALVKTVTSPSNKQFLVPETFDNDEDPGTPEVPVEAGMPLTVSISVTLSSEAGGGSGIGGDNFTIQENFPGGNVADNYYRPMLSIETEYDEGDEATESEFIVRTDGNGVATDEMTGDDVYGFAALPQDIAAQECTNRGLRLVSNPTAFSSYLTVETAGGKTEHWPYDVRMLWSSEKDATEPGSYFNYYNAVGYIYNTPSDSTGGGEFKVVGQDPASLALVVCEDIPK